MISKRMAWEKNWLLQHGWSWTEVEELASDERKVMPVEYLTRQAAFLDFELKVDKSTLIPRIETEELVRLTVNKIAAKKLNERGVWILEIGTGSGAVAIGLARELQKRNVCSRIVATDVSRQALQVAAENVERFNLQNQIELRRANLLSSDLIKDLEMKEKEWVIVANLPYIPTGRKKQLPKSVIDFEPATALFAGTDGLRMIRKMLNSVIRQRLITELIFLEIDEFHTQNDFEKWPQFHWTICKDWNQKNRYAIGERQ